MPGGELAKRPCYGRAGATVDAVDFAASIAHDTSYEQNQQPFASFEFGRRGHHPADDGSRLADVAEALVAGGVEVMEVTFTVPKAHRVLETVADRLGDKILLGAGTVLDT